MRYLSYLLLILVISCGDENTTTPTEMVDLEISMNHLFSGEELEGNEVYTNSSGNSLSITKLKYLLSNFSLMNSNGEEIELDSSYAFIDNENGRLSFNLGEVEVGSYSSISFNLGVDSLINSTDPNTFPSDSPLNPIVNDMYWNWIDGFIFLTLEGIVFENGAIKDAITYHIGLNKNQIRIKIDENFVINESGQLEINLDVAKIFDSQTRINIDDYPYVTHSKSDFGLSETVAENLKSSFYIE